MNTHDLIEYVDQNADTIQDLIAALQKADAWIAMYHNTPGHDVASRQMSSVIRAAIAKAKNEVAA